MANVNWSGRTVADPPGVSERDSQRGSSARACSPESGGVDLKTMALSEFSVRVCIAVSDIGRAVDFYEGKLGLPLVHKGPSASIAEGGRAYRSGGDVALNVFQSATAGKSEARPDRQIGLPVRESDYATVASSRVGQVGTTHCRLRRA